MLPRTGIHFIRSNRQLLPLLCVRSKADSATLTSDQKEKLRSKLPFVRTSAEEAKPSKAAEMYELSKEIDVQAEMDEIRARGFLKFNKNYVPPKNLGSIVRKAVMEHADVSADSWREFTFSDLDVKFKVLHDLATEIGFYIPNSDLHKMKTAADVMDFYLTPISNLTPYAKMARDDSLPSNLSIREHPARFHPDDIHAAHGGVTAFPGTGGNVISLRNKRLYRAFNPKKEWYDYEDQAFDYTPPDKGMPWDTEISKKMDRYVDTKFKLNTLK